MASIRTLRRRKQRKKKKPPQDGGMGQFTGVFSSQQQFGQQQMLQQMAMAQQGLFQLPQQPRTEYTGIPSPQGKPLPIPSPPPPEDESPKSDSWDYNKILEKLKKLI